MAKKVVVLLAPGFEEIEAVTPIDVLRRAGAEVTVAGVGTLTPKGARGVVFGADVLLEQLSGDFDLLVLPGGMPGAKNLGDSPRARALADNMIRSGKLVAAICAAPVMTLGAWGLLSGRKATCFPGMEGKFPADVAFSTERVVVDGNIVTGRGAGVAMEFALALVTRLLDPTGKLAAKLAADMVVT